MPCSRVGHFEKLSTAYCHAIFASLYLQSSIESRSDSSSPRTARRFRLNDYMDGSQQKVDADFSKKKKQTS